MSSHGQPSHVQSSHGQSSIPPILNQPPLPASSALQLYLSYALQAVEMEHNVRLREVAMQQSLYTQLINIPKMSTAEPPALVANGCDRNLNPGAGLTGSQQHSIGGIINSTTQQTSNVNTTTTAPPTPPGTPPISTSSQPIFPSSKKPSILEQLKIQKERQEKVAEKMHKGIPPINVTLPITTPITLPLTTPIIEFTEKANNIEANLPSPMNAPQTSTPPVPKAKGKGKKTYKRKKASVEVIKKAGQVPVVKRFRITENFNVVPARVPAADHISNSVGISYSVSVADLMVRLVHYRKHNDIAFTQYAKDGYKELHMNSVNPYIQLVDRVGGILDLNLLINSNMYAIQSITQGLKSGSSTARLSYDKKNGLQVFIRDDYDHIHLSNIIAFYYYENKNCDNYEQASIDSNKLTSGSTNCVCDTGVIIVTECLRYLYLQVRPRSTSEGPLALTQLLHVGNGKIASLVKLIVDSHYLRMAEIPFSQCIIRGITVANGKHACDKNCSIEEIISLETLNTFKRGHFKLIDQMLSKHYPQYYNGIDTNFEAFYGLFEESITKAVQFNFSLFKVKEVEEMIDMDFRSFWSIHQLHIIKYEDKYYEKYFLKALKVRRLVSDDFRNAFKNVDLLLTPTTLSDAPLLNDFVRNHNRDQCAVQDFCTCPANMAGIPAISIPVKLSSNKLPISLQLMGPNFSEQLVFSVAKFIEDSVNFLSNYNDKM